MMHYSLFSIHDAFNEKQTSYTSFQTQSTEFIFSQWTDGQKQCGTVRSEARVEHDFHEYLNLSDLKTP